MQETTGRNSARRDFGPVQRLQRRGIAAIAVVIFNGRAGDQCQIAACLVIAQRAGRSMSAQQKRLHADMARRTIGIADAIAAMSKG